MGAVKDEVCHHLMADDTPVLVGSRVLLEDARAQSGYLRHLPIWAKRATSQSRMKTADREKLWSFKELWKGQGGRGFAGPNHTKSRIAADEASILVVQEPVFVDSVSLSPYTSIGDNLRKKCSAHSSFDFMGRL